VLVPGAISGNQAIALARCRKETCSLSLMSALRVNSGTGAEPKDHVVRGGPGSNHIDRQLFSIFRVKSQCGLPMYQQKYQQ
jgi:hypothetical protein